MAARGERATHTEHRSARERPPRRERSWFGPACRMHASTVCNPTAVDDWNDFVESPVRRAAPPCCLASPLTPAASHRRCTPAIPAHVVQLVAGSASSNAPCRLAGGRGGMVSAMWRGEALQLVSCECVAWSWLRVARQPHTLSGSGLGA
jgi:hypothetical protein